jgi:hypothetical protein
MERSIGPNAGRTVPRACVPGNLVHPVSVAQPPNSTYGGGTARRPGADARAADDLNLGTGARMTSSPTLETVAGLGGGNLGAALANGWARSGRLAPVRVHVTRRHAHKLADRAAELG